MTTWVGTYRVTALRVQKVTLGIDLAAGRRVGWRQST